MQNNNLLNEDATHEKIVLTSGSHNCGGRCIIKVHVRDGRIVRISTDDDLPDTDQTLQLRGCLRCRSYRDRLYHPDRLKYPLRRVGKRGEGKFERITWDEALDTIADHTNRIMSKYGPEAIYLNYATGNAGKAAERVWMARLMGLYGGYLSYYGTYSTACTQIATPYTFGTNNTGNSREDWVNSKLIILLGWNPAETINGTNTAYYLKLAKAAGAKIIAIDPIYSNTAIALSDQWIPIRPTTDSALLEAMAYIMITENLHDQRFLDTYCLGFDEEHMLSGIPQGNSYKSYILGQSKDKTPKTPAWAEPITGVPREIIIQLARDYATMRPGALIQGYGPQRHAYGDWLSMSCNHCQDPICVKDCPTGAMQKRLEDGIVFIDQERCIGCRICAERCPYGAPQYNFENGKMGKCDFCGDLLAEGKPPVCVAACPLRLLKYGQMDELRQNYGSTNRIQGMPSPEQTKPSLIIAPHRDAIWDKEKI